MDIFINNLAPLAALLLPSLILLVASSVIKRRASGKLKLVLVSSFTFISAALCTVLCFCLVSFGGGLNHIFPIVILHLILSLI